MKNDMIYEIQVQMKLYLNQGQYLKLTRTLMNVLEDVNVESEENIDLDNFELLEIFLSVKQVEGCSSKTLNYYRSTISKMLDELDKCIEDITTDDLRNYLSEYKESRKSVKDNNR